MAEQQAACHICEPLAHSGWGDSGSIWPAGGAWPSVPLSDLPRRVAALSHGLSSRLKVGVGDVVLLAAHNSLHMLEAILAAADTGAIVGLVNWRWSQQELQAALDLALPTIIIVDGNCHEAMAPLLGSAELVNLGHRTASQPTNPHAITSEELITGSSLDTTRCSSALQLRQGRGGAAVLCFTSGTTGRSKGVLLSHHSLVAQSHAKLQVVGYSSDDTYLHTAPLFHVGGLSSALACVMAGASQVFLPKYSSATALAAIRQLHVSAFIAVPAMLHDLAQAEAAQRRGPILCVRMLLVGAGTTTAGLQVRLRLSQSRSLAPEAQGHMSA